MTGPEHPQTYSYRSPDATVGLAFAHLGCSAVPAALVGGIGLLIAAAAGSQVVRTIALALAGALFLLVLGYFASGWWRVWFTLKDTGSHVAVQYGRGGHWWSAKTFDKSVAIDVEIYGSHGNYSLQLSQGGVVVQLGDSKKAFPEPYLGLVVWLSGRGITVTEKWDYPGRPNP